MSKILATLLFLALTACTSEGISRPANRNEPVKVGACDIYMVMVDGRVIIASPNCHVAAR